MIKNLLIVGLDGAGKTTHARKLMVELSKQGIRTRYVYMRGYGRVFLAFPFLVLSRLLGFTKVHVLKNGNRVSEYRFFTNSAFRILWPWISLVDSLLYSFFIFRILPLFSNSLIIADRSVIDNLVDIVADTQVRCPFQSYARFFINLIPKDSVVIFFDVDESTALRRKRDIANLRYLRVRRQTYKKLASSCCWATVDTNAEFASVHRNFLEVFYRSNQHFNKI